MEWAGLAAGAPAQDLVAQKNQELEKLTHYLTWPSSSDLRLFEKSHGQYYVEIYRGGRYSRPFVTLG